MSPVPFPLAFFLGVFFQTLLVGAFIPLLIVASYAQWKKVSRGQELNLVTALTTIFFGLVIPIHWALGMRRVLLAALYPPSGLTVDQFLEPPYGPDEITRWAIFQLELVVGDFVMIYRMYHIYNKSILACVIPSIVTSGLIVISFGLTNSLRTLNTLAAYNTYEDWTTACFCVTLFNSTFMSAAISHRLWKVNQGTLVSGTHFKSDSVVLRAMRVLVESAALWTFFVLANFFAFLAKSNLSVTFLHMTGPVVGISFCLIIVRLGAITAEVREDTWASSQRSRASRVRPISDSPFSRLPLPLDRVKVERDIYVTNDSESGIEFQTANSISGGEKSSPDQ